MKYAKLAVVTALVLVLFFGYNQWVFALGLFRLYSNDKFTAAGLEKVKKFDPDIDILYLPGIEDKDFFESVADFSICRKNSVREFLYLYLTSGREYTLRSIVMSDRHMDAINDVFSDNPDIPRDIALLPLLESGFNENAVSRSNAVGLWQFIRTTSEHLGLTTGPGIDERRNVRKSTEAAVRHLRHLYRMFGSWELALAAYNCGETQMKRAIELAGTDNIWHLAESGALPAETSEYLPRFAALLIIYKNPRLFGIDDEINRTISPIKS